MRPDDETRTGESVDGESDKSDNGNDELPWEPWHIHDTISASNPIELFVESDVLRALILSNIERMEAALSDSDVDLSDFERDHLRSLVARRKELSRWAQARGDDLVMIGCYPNIDDEIRERVQEAEGVEKL